jgi:pimeloyl-ACP methyl ester carboxylesterase
MKATTQFVSTDILRVEYLEWNPEGKRTAVLVHGWPDSARCWNEVAPGLVSQGYRVVAPSVRGFGGTRFLSQASPRSGQLSVLGLDLLGFIDALQLNQPVLVGHDWGARSVANACGLRPGVGSHLVMISVGYGTNSPDQALSYQQIRNYWYHWFMATERGERAVREDAKGFTRQMWDTWSPPGWFSEAEFLETAKAFDNPDWADIVLHSYRQRWGHAPAFSEYAEYDAKLNPAPVLDMPVLALHGASDFCNHPDGSLGKERFFKRGYTRVLIDGVGHFPQREAPARVCEEIIKFCT